MKPNDKNIPEAIPTPKVDEATDLIRETVNVLESMNRSTSADLLQEESRSMSGRPYRIAVVGAFKNGKSTLINAAFLGQDLLFTDTTEATCVPTELNWGDKSRMSIYPYSDALQPTLDGCEPIRLRTGEETPVVVTSPTPKDIRMETSADTPGDREFKAKTISKVTVELPYPSLQGITVVDSPGIDSTSEAVLHASLRIVPSCDSVLFVTRGGQLSQVEEEFLRSGVLDQGIARAMVVINHFDNQTPLGREGRQEHIEALRSRLRALGRGHLQVTMVDARQWLHATLNQEPTPKDALEFSSMLREFITKDLAKARLEKSLEVTKREIRSALVELATITGLREKNETERKRIAENLSIKTDEAHSRLENIRQDFEYDFADHLYQFRNALRTGITNAVQQAKVQLRATTDFASLKDQLGSVQTKIRPQIEACYLDATRNLKRDLQSSNERFNREVRSAVSNLNADTIQSIGDDISLPPIPAPVVTVLDYLIVVFASPLPLVADIILRMLADRFPDVRKLMPTGIAKSMAQNWIEKQLDMQVSKTLEEIESRIQAVKSEALVAVDRSLQNLLDNEVAPLKKALSGVDQQELPLNAGEVKSFEERLNGLYTQVSAIKA